MNDYYLLLTPFLLLGIVGLLGFVGCAQIIGIEPWKGSPDTGDGTDELPPPTGLSAVAGDAVVHLTWDAYNNATEYHLKRGNIPANYDTTFPLNPQNAAYDDAAVVNGELYYYAVSALVSATETKDSDEVKATPMASAPNAGYFVTNSTLGSFNNQFEGWAGMEILVDANDIIVSKVGRVFGTNNIQQHAIKIKEKTTLVDLTVAILDTAGGTDGEFQYVDLTSPVTLLKDTSYYIVSKEISGGDHFYQDDSTITHTTAAKVVSAVSGDDVSPYNPSASQDHCFGPLDFYYEVAP